MAASGKIPTSRFNCGKAAYEIEFDCNSKLFTSRLKNPFRSPQERAGSPIGLSAKKPCHPGLEARPRASNKDQKV